MRSNEDAGKDPRQLEHEVEQQRRQIGETINALEDKFSPGELYSQAAGYIRDYGGDFGRNLSNSIRANPLPVAITAIGLAWMMMGQRRGGSYPTPYDRPRQDHDISNDIYGNSTAIYGHRGGEGYTAGLSSGMAGTGAESGKHESTMNKLKSKGQALKGKGSELKGKMMSAREHASDTGHDLRSRASATGEDLRHRAASTGRHLRDSASHAREGLYHSMGSARSNLEYYMREQPLAMGAVGLAIGAIVGAAMPRTQTENRAFGEINERGRHKAKEMVEEGYEKARQVGESVSREAQNAMHSQRASESGSTSAGADHQGPSATT